MEKELIDFAAQYWWGILLILYILSRLMRRKQKNLEIKNTIYDKQIDNNSEYTKSNDYEQGSSGYEQRSNDYEQRSNISEAEKKYLIEKIREHMASKGLLEDKEDGDYYFKESLWKSDISIYVTQPKKFLNISNIRSYAHFAIVDGTEWHYNIGDFIELRTFDSSFKDLKQLFKNDEGEILRLSVTSEGSLEKFKELYPKRWELLKDW